MTDVSAFQPRFIRANGLEFGYLEAVPKRATSAPLALILHGFPDNAWSFCGLLKEVADAGYHGVAVFMRGYAPTSLAEDRDYSRLALGRDVIALIEHFGADRAHVVGHDWGATAAYAAAAMRPDRLQSIIAAGVPHPRRLLLRPSRAQWRSSRYIWRFQFRRSAERLVARDDFVWLQDLVRSWAKDWMPDEDYWERIKAAFSDRIRLQAALRYYRALPRPLFRRDGWTYLLQPIQVPTTVICGLEDGCVLPSSFEGQAHLFGAGYVLERMAGVGHLMHLQAPEAFSRLVLEGLERGGSFG